MNSVSEALNTLIAAVNVAHEKGGVYSLKESHHIYTSIEFLESLSQEQAQAEKTQVEQPRVEQPHVEEVVQETHTPQNMEYNPGE